MVVNIRLLTDTALVPKKGTNKSAGYDLYADREAYIEPGKTVMINTGIAMEIPNGFFGGIYARSGLSIKQGLRPSNCVGVIDSDYRGEIMVALYNDSNQLRYVEKGDRVAQMIFQEYADASFNLIDVLNSTERGDGGFGSTGM